MRPLPPLTALRAFEAAARHGNFVKAAADLGVTAGAVSHHVKQLETEIGKPLFVRRNNGIALTRDGRLLFDEVAPALKAIARARDFGLDVKLILGLVDREEGGRETLEKEARIVTLFRKRDFA